MDKPSVLIDESKPFLRFFDKRELSIFAGIWMLLLVNFFVFASAEQQEYYAGRSSGALIGYITGMAIPLFFGSKIIRWLYGKFMS